MAPTSTATHHSAWIPWATFVATIIIIRLRSRRHIISAEAKEPLSTPEPFPWEPNSSSVQGKQHNQTITPNAEGEQLQFLACMTFAANSLRAPSCPCCQ
jgi:hypothetical protein